MLRRFITVALIGITASTALTGLASARGSDDPYYVSLGDSLAFGFSPPYQRNPASLQRGYADQLFTLEKTSKPQLQMVKLGCGGETTESMITGAPYCPFPEGSQLDQAVSVLQAHEGHIEFVTIDVGANDIFNTCLHFRSGVLDPDCVDAVLPSIKANLTTIIETVRETAPGVPIFGMNYYDPFLGYWVQGPNGKPADPDLARVDHRAWEKLNAGLADIYQVNNVPVADVAGAFDVSDFDDMVTLNHFGQVPTNVANACTWTYTCTPPPLGWDVHPNAKGYRVIATAFAELLNS
jgi:lysophospholipase L1-like esterase